MRIYKILMALLLAVALVGCNGSSSQNDAHNHDEKLLLTAYNDTFEVFVESTPFAVGEQSSMVAYITTLENFKPLQTGNVTISLIIRKDGIRQTANKPVREGVYQFSLQPSATGTGKLVFDIQTADSISQLIIPNIIVYANEDDAQHAAMDAEISSSNSAVFTKGQSWKVDFATTEVKKNSFGPVIRTTAQILPSQGDERIITAKTSGVVSFTTISITDGQAVNAGQTLFSIEGGGMADNDITVRYNEAESEYQRTKAEYERKKELAADKIVSETELLRAKTEFTNAESTYTNLRRNFSAGKQQVSSPISGYITQVLVRNGEYVESGKPILVVSQNKELQIRAELQPSYFSVLGNIVSANIRVLDMNKTYTLEELEGKVMSYGRSTDIANPLIPVIFQVKNSAGFLPGSFVEMYIKTQTNSQAITVPNEALIEEMGNYFVYVQLTPELFEKRSVQKGNSDGLNTEIKEGISVGERIVSKGALMVKLAQSSGALDAHSGHVH